MEGLALAALGRVSGLCHTAAAGTLLAARYLTDNSIATAPTAAAAADLAFRVRVAQHAIRFLKAPPPPTPTREKSRFLTRLEDEDFSLRSSLLLAQMSVPLRPPLPCEQKSRKIQKLAFCLTPAASGFHPPAAFESFQSC